jgi:DNA polymerase-3 subunit beta
LTWVGLDGHRLSKITTENSFDPKIGKLLIPADAMEEVAHAVAEEDDVVVYLLKKSQQVVLKYATIELAARQVEGAYPDYKVALPKEEKTKLILSNGELLKAVKMAQLFSSEESANRVEFSYEKDKLTIASSGGKVGENTTVLEAKGDGEGFKAAFNAHFLSEILSRIHSEQVVFSTFIPATDDKLRGGVFREEENDNFFHLVMPLFTS